MAVMDDYKLACWVRRGARRVRILNFLYYLADAVTGVRIARDLKLSLHKVSHTLSEFRHYGLVRVLNPKARSRRDYVLSETGKRIVRRLR